MRKDYPSFGKEDMILKLINTELPGILNYGYGVEKLPVF